MALTWLRKPEEKNLKLLNFLVLESEHRKFFRKSTVSRKFKAPKQRAKNRLLLKMFHQNSN